MGLSDLPANDATARTTSGRHLVLLLATFTAAIFVSAALLFMVQPMFTKMVLPRLGGAPSVWSVAIVFFQGALLAGYAYAPWLTRYAPGRASILVHLVVTAAAVFALPLSIATGWARPPEAGETLWLMGLFAASIGLPFFALAANSPLLQAWFARTDHPAAKDPYFLYAASNIGSFLALVSYPSVIEPFVGLRDQAKVWSLGFGLLIALLARLRRAAVAVPAIRRTRRRDRRGRHAADPAQCRVLGGVAAVPSGSLVAVTAHISTDVAAVPLLWVLRARALPPDLRHRVRAPPDDSRHWLVVAVQPVFVIGPRRRAHLRSAQDHPRLVAVHPVVFFVNALMCHGELARTCARAPRYLTGFYLWMATGGVVGAHRGGADRALRLRLGGGVSDPAGAYAPVPARPRAAERTGLAHPAVRRARGRGTHSDRHHAQFGRAVGDGLQPDLRRPPDLKRAVLARTPALGRDDRVRPSGQPQHCRAGGRHVGAQLLRRHQGVGNPGRPVSAAAARDHAARRPAHSRIQRHGARRAARTADVLLGRSAISQAFDAVRARVNGPIRFAVIGLGAGSLACRAEPGDTVHFYEIDPAMIRIARDPYLFSFLWLCRPVATITLGDARLTLADAPDGAYDLLVVDAFSSDAIPIHLMTREAMAMYKAKLAPHGMLVMHISNRHLELASVVAGIAAANGLITFIDDSTDIDEAANPYKYSGTVAAVARSEEDFGMLAQSRDWELKTPDPAQWVWTDDYSNIVGAVLRKLKE
jgi:hypothetical protein